MEDNFHRNHILFLLPYTHSLDVFSPSLYYPRLYHRIYNSIFAFLMGIGRLKPEAVLLQAQGASAAASAEVTATAAAAAAAKAAGRGMGGEASLSDV